MNSKIYTIDGVELEMHTIGELASRLDRQLQTMRKWEKLGVIPQATYRSGSNRRLYTNRQIDAIVDCVKRYNLRQGMPVPAEFKEEVARAFEEATEADFTAPTR